MIKLIKEFVACLYTNIHRTNMDMNNLLTHDCSIVLSEISDDNLEVLKVNLKRLKRKILEEERIRENKDLISKIESMVAKNATYVTYYDKNIHETLSHLPSFIFYLTVIMEKGIGIKKTGN